MARQKIFTNSFRSMMGSSRGSFWKRTNTTTSSFRVQSLGRMAKIGAGGALLGGTLLYGWDQFEQNKTRLVFDEAKPKGHTSIVSTTCVQQDELDDYEFSSDQTLTEHFGAGTKVKVGGGRKEGFRGIIPLPSFLESPSVVRTQELDRSDICHVGIVVQPSEDKDARPLIIGRQSPKGPLPTLMSAIDAAWKQFSNPVEGQTIGSVMEKALQTTVANEAPHMSEGTAFDTMVIDDLAIPVEFVDEAVQAAKKDLNPVMTFAWDNCMTTKSYTLLKLVERVDEWANSSEPDAPSREQANSFIVGCYEIIEKDIHARGYGVLNNNKIAEELGTLKGITASMSRVVSEELDKPNSCGPC